MSERVLICGDRHWGDQPGDRMAMYLYVEALPSDAVIIEGEARGADQMARAYAEARGLTVERYPADWKRYGRAAGPIRNRQMLDEGKPTRVAYAHRDLANSRGTADMVKQARKRGIPVEPVVPESK